jgi:hypothetical protein
VTNIEIEHSGDEFCPYSEPPYGEFTDDHIFPQFLGGRRTIRVCRRCNNSFGHSFEGRASTQLKRMQVFISNFGLDLSKNSAIWPSALVIDDKTYDLKSGPEGAQYQLSRPTVVRGGDGRIIGGKARSMSEANKIAKGILASGQAKEVEISPDPSPTLEDIKLTAAFSFDEDLFRFATKLTVAVVVASGNRRLISSSGIPEYLHSKGSWPTRVAYCDVTKVRQLRPPLTHTVYVELGQYSYAIVLIFGCKKIFLPLPSSTVNQGFLATLDPLTGEERYFDVDPIGPISVQPSIQKEVVLAHLQDMLNSLSQEAVLRGAKRHPDLTVTNVDLGPPWPTFWTDSTLRFMYPTVSGEIKKS